VDVLFKPNILGVQKVARGDAFTVKTDIY